MTKYKLTCRGCGTSYTLSASNNAPEHTACPVCKSTRIGVLAIYRYPQEVGSADQSACNNVSR